MELQRNINESSLVPRLKELYGKKMKNLIIARQKLFRHCKINDGRRQGSSPLGLAWKCFEEYRDKSVQVEEMTGGRWNIKLTLQMVLRESVETRGRLRIIGGTTIDRIVEQLGTNRNLIIVSFL